MLNKLGAQLYTVRDYCHTPAEIRETFQKVRDIGYKCVQCSGLGEIDPHELGDISIETGLPIVCTHIPYSRLSTELDKVIEEHKVYGCDYIGIGSMPSEFKDDSSKLKDFIRFCNKTAEEVAAAGLRFGYHNHSFEFSKIGGKRIIDMLVEETNPENFSFILDTYWIQHGGGDVCKWIRDLKGRIFMLHLKDMGISDGKQFYTEILEGNMNFDAIIGTAKETGVSYYLVEQDICPGNPFDSLKLSFDNLKRNLFAD